MITSRVNETYHLPITPRFDQQYSNIAQTLRQTDRQVNRRTDETTHNTCFTQHSWRVANKRLSITFGYGCIFPGVKYPVHVPDIAYAIIRYITSLNYPLTYLLI